MPRPKPATGGWDELHRRTTFYCPVDLVEALERAMTVSGRSKSQVIVDALQEHLAAPSRTKDIPAE